MERMVRVSNLKWFVTEQQLEEACGRYGRVKAVKISLDKVCLILTVVASNVGDW